MNIKIRYILFVLISIIVLCTSCREDVSYNPASGNYSGLTLYVPSLNTFASRSNIEDEEELRYTSLFFFAFPTDDTDPIIVPLPFENNSLSFQDEYLTYPINLPNGKYKFYLIANVYDATTNLTDLPQNEKDLKKDLFHIPLDFNCRISEKGLPMSSSHSNFYILKSDGTQQSIDTDGYLYEGKNESICALLYFLYAKITVNPMDAYGNPVKLSEVKFTNISEKEPVLFSNGFLDYGQNSEISITDTDENEIPDSYKFYIPERYVSQSSAEDQSCLSFKIGNKQISIPLGETEDNKEDIINSVPSAEMHRKIVRGTNYKYTLSTLLDIRLEVSDWNSDKIFTNIKGPIYLHIEKQEYPISAGEVTEVWFKSDVEDVYLDSPLYNYGGKNIPLYVCDKEYSAETQEGILKIYVNKDIPTSEYDNIMEDTDNYNFFHIVAGSIHKRIKVTPLELNYYLEVSPLNIPIDVSMRIASSQYDGTIPITIHTNYPNLNVTLTDGSDWNSFNDASNNAFLKLLDPDGNEVTDQSYISVGSTGTAIYNLEFQGLNTGSDIWKNKKTLELSVVGSEEYISSREIVNVNIIPLVQDYVIHFKADGWSKPHVYIYECLEFPADWPGVYSPNDDDNDDDQPVESLASKPLGYYGGKENGEDAYYAALEYSFTGAIAFNGWDVPANLETLYYTNGSPRPFDGYKAQGFYIFNTDQDSWKPNLPEKAGIRYSFNMDFCAEHREAIKGSCTDCANTSSMNRLWPGIMMKDEGDGWWEFTLTGIATPGKTLIMFADGHSGNNDNRYPGAAEVGVPLFDYPSKEGWLRYNGDMTDRIHNQFSSVKPAN